jgi:hypothetical protein
MALRIEDIDLGGGLIHVRRGCDQYEGRIRTNSGKTRKVSIATALRAHLAEHPLALGWREGLAFGTGPRQRGRGRRAARHVPHASLRRPALGQPWASRVLMRPDSTGLDRRVIGSSKPNMALRRGCHKREAYVH